MRKILLNSLGALSVIGAMLCGGCYNDSGVDAAGNLFYLTVAEQNIHAVDIATEYAVKISSNSSWSISSDSDWLTVTSDKGENEEVITLQVETNEGLSRSGKIEVRLKKSDVLKVINVYQSGLKLFGEDFGGEAVASSGISPNDFQMWSHAGKEQDAVSYKAEGIATLILPTPSSSGFYQQASGGNMLAFGSSGDEFIINGIKAHSKAEMTLSFGVALFDNARKEYGEVTASAISVFASLNGMDWTPLSYKLFDDDASLRWHLVESQFGMPDNSDVIHLRFVSASQAPFTAFIDDIKLTYGGENSILVGDFETAKTTTGEATEIGAESVTFNGYYALNSNSIVVEKYFEYWTTDVNGSQLGQTIKVASDPLMSKGTAYSVGVNTSLQTPVLVNTTYAYRAVIKYKADKNSSQELILSGTTMPFKTINPEKNITVAQLRELNAGVVTDNYYVNGYVVSDSNGGNLPNGLSVYIADDTKSGGSWNYDARGILLQLNNVPSQKFIVGTNLRVKLTGATLDKSGTIKVSGISETGITRGEQKTIEPLPLTFATLDSKYESMLVSISDAQLKESLIPSNGAYLKYVANNSATSRDLEVKNGSALASIKMYTYPSATFAVQAIPLGRGSLVGILSPQGLMMRKADDASGLNGKRLNASGVEQGVIFRNIRMSGGFVAGKPSTGTIELDYFNANALTLVSISANPVLMVGGSESGAFKGMPSKVFNKTYDSSFGTITLDLSQASWTPAESGNVKIKLSSGGILNASIDKFVAGSELTGPKALASWMFDFGQMNSSDLPYMQAGGVVPDISSTIAGDYAGKNAILTARRSADEQGGFTNTGLVASSSDPTKAGRFYAYVFGWKVGSSWVIKIPMKNALSQGREVEISSVMWVYGNASSDGAKQSPGEWKYTIASAEGRVVAESSAFRIKHTETPPTTVAQLDWNRYTTKLSLDNDVNEEFMYVYITVASASSVGNPSNMFTDQVNQNANHVRIGYISVKVN